MYPRWLVNSMMFVSPDAAVPWVRAEGDGAFALLKKFKRATDAQGKKTSKSAAMANALGNTQLARGMLMAEDDTQIDVVYQDAGRMWSVAMRTDHLSRITTIERFIAHFNSCVGANLNRDKFLYPGKMYEVAM